MPSPKAKTVRLSEKAQSSLRKLVSRHQTGQQIALRGRIILSASEGLSNKAVAEKLFTTSNTVSLWRNRWVLLEDISLDDLSVEERLQDLPRPGAPAQITADQRCQIEALACEKPENSGRPITHWSGREIADEIVKRGILPHISPRHAARLLKRS